ncbi:MAG: hypothetical protein VYC58_07325, partial [Pseudomonadota bacterium]|nr:hypothetical protein [Pseudomonadota bacterium]
GVEIGFFALSDRPLFRNFSVEESNVLSQLFGQTQVEKNLIPLFAKVVNSPRKHVNQQPIRSNI